MFNANDKEGDMKKPEEMLFGNATIWAGKPIGKMQGCMRISDGKIVEIFEHDHDTPAKANATDLKNAHIIPGLIDAHQHFFVTALMALFGDASRWNSKEDVLDAIQEAACKSGSPNEWIFFSKLDYDKWKRPVPPSIKEIDAVSKGAPVFVSDITLHRGIVSSETMKRVGLSRQTLRFADDIATYGDGTPSGIIWEDALGRVLFAMYRDVISRSGDEKIREIFLDEARRCLQMGLTHVHDPGVPSDVQKLLKEVQERTPLKISWSVAAQESLYTSPGMKDEEHAVACAYVPKSVKFFLDGAHRASAGMPIVAGLKAAVRAGKDSISAHSLWPVRKLFEQKIVLSSGRLTLPYQRFTNIEELIKCAYDFTDKGYRLVIHALGNVAARQAAAAINRLKPTGGASVEHLLVMDDEDLDVFAGCGAVASLQPGFIPHYADVIERMGAVPYLKPFPLRSLMNRSVPVCISSDGPCGPDDPLFNMRRAVDRKTPDGSIFDPDERISEADSLAAVTFGGSDSMGIGNQGLQSGAPATFCIVDGDPFAESSRVVQTWIDGKRAY